MSWSDDPELVATFRAEVEDRLTSLKEGLLRLEDHPSPRQLVASLFRDAHTVKGSARMLGLDQLVRLAHRAEDLLGGLRDGRVPVRGDLVDLLLIAAEVLGRSLPGAERPVTDDTVAEVVAALDAALAGADPVPVPRLPTDPVPEPEPEEAYDAGRGGEHVRIPTRRVHELLDQVSEVQLDLRRMQRSAHEVTALLAEAQAALRQLRSAAHRSPVALPTELADAVGALTALDERLGPQARRWRAGGEDALARLERVRTGAMGLAMVPVRRVLAAFPALVRELSAGCGKQVALEIDGADVELDVAVLDGVAEALRHLVTNAVDHGCETPAERAAAGKPRQATVRVRARQAGSTVVIEVADDGAGIDEDALRERAVQAGLLPVGSTLGADPLLRLLFTAGFTTRDDVTETSGRGVGLDVVRTAVERLGGSVELTARLGEGTSFTLTLPVTTGVLRCLLVRCGEERYAVPMAGVLETVALADVEIQSVAGTEVLPLQGESVPLVALGAVLGTPGDPAPRAAVVARTSGQTLAWGVDRVEGESEMVVGPLGGFLGHPPAVAGATRDEDGAVLLLLDLRDLAARRGSALAAPAPVPVTTSPRLVPSEPGPAPDDGTRPTVLVVEDSVGVRELQRTILEGAGYCVLTAVDGLDGAARLVDTPVDLVLSDVEMPGMDGFTLTRTIRQTRGWENVPVVIMTSRGDDADKHAGLDAGADAYLLKSEFDQHALVATVRRLVGR